MALRAKPWGLLRQMLPCVPSGIVEPAPVRGQEDQHFSI